MITYTQQDYLNTLTKAGLVIDSNLYGHDADAIQGLTYNSKEAATGTLFVCKGAAFHPQYLADAVFSGATLYVSERKYELDTKVPYILVSDIRKAMPYLGKLFFNDPSKELNLIGVGGTKGKSTTAYYIKAIVDDYLASIGKKESAVISSIDVYDGVTKVESHITTPENIELLQHFRNAVDSDIDFLEMEVSSQALKYNRVDQITFDAAIFLNISEDHISPIEHPDFEDYFSSKLKMFAQTKHALINTNSDYFERVAESAKDAENVITFGTKPGSDILGYDIEKIDHEIHFRVRCDRFDEDFALTMPGLFNVENALAAIAAAYVFNIPVEFMKSGLYRARSSGRMETYMSADKNVIAVVDYAHNKLSFDKLFSSTRKEYPDYDIISIFGCPGKKAVIRRHDLGTIAGMYSKKVYIVAEDPGAEPVKQISKDIAQYVEAQYCPYEMIEDRGEAIRKAIMTSEGKSILLITGKGNETRQKYGSEYLDCPSDVEYTKKYLAEYDASHQA